MNIFILDNDQKQSAIAHVNRHIVKQILELAQMISTAHRVLDGNDIDTTIKLYRPTHQNHPCSVWVRKTKANYIWSTNFLSSLGKEYTYRYGKHHKTIREILPGLIRSIPKNIDPSNELTPFALAMPDQYKIANNAVESYRNYYCAEKTDLFSWKDRDVPKWITTNPHFIKKILSNELILENNNGYRSYRRPME